MIVIAHIVGVWKLSIKIRQVTQGRVGNFLGVYLYRRFTGDFDFGFVFVVFHKSYF